MLSIAFLHSTFRCQIEKCENDFISNLKKKSTVTNDIQKSFKLMQTHIFLELYKFSGDCRKFGGSKFRFSISNSKLKFFQLLPAILIVTTNKRLSRQNTYINKYKQKWLNNELFTYFFRLNRIDFFSLSV